MYLMHAFIYVCVNFIDMYVWLSTAMCGCVCVAMCGYVRLYVHVWLCTHVYVWLCLYPLFYRYEFVQKTSHESVSVMQSKTGIRLLK